MDHDKQPQFSDIIFYSFPEGNVKVEVIFNDETFWLSQKRMAELFGVEINTINYHLKEIFTSGELTEDATIRKIRIVQKKFVICRMLHSRSPSAVTGHPTKQRVQARKHANNGARPTLYSLFHLSVFCLIIWIVVVLGGLLCILKV